jgi:hypothetical protein
MKRWVLSVALLFSTSIGSAIHAQTVANSAVMSVPAGTSIHVRMIDSVDVNSAQSGSRFRGSLAEPVSVGRGGMVIPRGAPVQLTAVNIQRAGRVEGRDRINLRVDSITFRGRVYPVTSSISETRGGKRGRRTLTGAGIGAAGGGAIGAIAGGGTGALVGALVGGGGGAAVSAGTGKRNLSIPAETVLTFQLKAPLLVR